MQAQNCDKVLELLLGKLQLEIDQGADGSGLAATELLKAVRSYTGQIQLAKAKAASEREAAEGAAKAAAAEAEEAAEQKAREEWNKANPGCLYQKGGTQRVSPY